MLEVDPTRPNKPAVKHSWLGRFRHEAVSIRAVPGHPLQVYSGCDRHGGHLYRFMSRGLVNDPADPANSQLLEEGRLEVARFDAPGSDGQGKGRWLPLDPSSPVNPALPSHLESFGIEQPTLVPHGDRSRAGAEALVDDRAVNHYRSRYRTLADLYLGRGDEQMGAILIDAHLDANAIGAPDGKVPRKSKPIDSWTETARSLSSFASFPSGQIGPRAFQIVPLGQGSWPSAGSMGRR